MANDRLYALFDEQNKVAKDLIASAPKTINDIVSVGAADISGVNAQIDMSQRVLPSVDYSNFSNFVFFNSALDYFNISGDRIIREWPYDGTYSDQLLFLSASDAYQTYLADVWPRWHGYANFSGTNTYVTASDTGIMDGNSKSALLCLTGTSGSITIEGHIKVDEMPASGDAQVIVQRFSGTSETFTLYIDNTSLHFGISGSTMRYDRSMPMTTGSRWFAVSCNRDYNNNDVTMSFYTTDPTSDAISNFQDGPRNVSMVTSAASLDSSNNVSGKVSVAMGFVPNIPDNITPLNFVSPTFKLSELRMWNTVRTDHELFANYNLRVFSEPALITYWRFCEGYTRNNAVVKDYSGRGMHGKVIGSTTNFWVSSSLESDQPNYFGMSPQDTGEYILPPNPQDDNTLWNFISTTQASGALYDRDNTNIITSLVPYQFLYLEEDRNTEVLKNLLYLLGRQFDELKVKIDQFSKLLTINYTGFNQTPDALLADAMKFWGWDSKGNFLSKEAFQHFFGYDALTVAPSPTASLSATYLPPAALNNQASYDNQRLDTVLADIKTEFWKRTLNNLIYIYKTKGTKESVEALLRIYGLDDRLVKVKEFGLKQNVSIQTNRIASEKSFWAYHISGTAIVETSNRTIPMNTVSTTALQIRFPTEYNIAPTSSNQWNFKTGSIFFNRYADLGAGALATPLATPLGGPIGLQSYEELQYMRSPGSITGTLVYAAYSGTNEAIETQYITASNMPIFDGRWYNVMMHRSGNGNEVHVTLHTQHLDEDRIDIDKMVTGVLTSSLAIGLYDFSLGRHLTASSSGSEFWSHNVQVWDSMMSEVEMSDHTLNPFSFGAETPEAALSLSLNWQMDYDVDQGQQVVWDSTIHKNHGMTIPSCSYDRFSRPYNFIASPDYGWNEEKIRTFSGSVVPYGSQWLESNAVSVEFNLIDALNEDVSLMLASMDNWNNVIGDAANRHRDTYPNLERFRQQYFSRLTGRINFRAFADFMDFFDRSFVDMIRKLLPARVNFKGAEFVVESHMLERPKVQYTYRRHNPVIVPEGVITIVGHPPGLPAGLTTPSGPPGPPVFNPPSNFRVVTPAEPLSIQYVMAAREYATTTATPAYDIGTGFIDHTNFLTVIQGGSPPLECRLPKWPMFITKTKLNVDGTPNFNMAHQLWCNQSPTAPTWQMQAGLDSTTFLNGAVGSESAFVWLDPTVKDATQMPPLLDMDTFIIPVDGPLYIGGTGFTPDMQIETKWIKDYGITDTVKNITVTVINSNWLRITGGNGTLCMVIITRGTDFFELGPFDTSAWA